MAALLCCTLLACGNKGKLKTPTQIEKDDAKKAKKAEKAQQEQQDNNEDDLHAIPLNPSQPPAAGAPAVTLPEGQSGAK